MSHGLGITFKGTYLLRYSRGPLPSELFFILQNSALKWGPGPHRYLGLWETVHIQTFMDAFLRTLSCRVMITFK